MKQIFTSLAAVFALGFATAQTNLQNIYKIELGFQGISAGTELPIAKNLLTDLNVGYGGITDVWTNGLNYEWNSNSSSIFARAQLRYYISRDRREEKGHNMANNAGTFVALQTKFTFQGKKDDFVGKTSFSELQFGQQLPIGQRIFFRYHAGLGYGRDVDHNIGRMYPALGFAFGLKL